MPWRESEQELQRARAEQPVVIPTSMGALYGILTPPAPEAPPAGLCAVLFTRPRSHRNRIWVEAARRLAVHGFTCFRFDYHGTGDSEGESTYLNPNRPYQEDALAVLRHLREEFGQRRFVLSGLCFDARTALSAVDGEGDAIAGLVFMAAPLMELDTMAKVDAEHRTWRRLGPALLKPSNWRGLLKPARLKYMSGILGSIVAGAINWRRSEQPLSTTFLNHLESLARSEARALFLYGTEDAEYRTFSVAQRSLFPTLPAHVRQRFEITVWPGVVHSGTLNVARQREILSKAVDWILALHPALQSHREVRVRTSAPREVERGLLADRRAAGADRRDSVVCTQRAQRRVDPERHGERVPS